jgi:hypothetical protein
VIASELECSYSQKDLINFAAPNLQGLGLASGFFMRDQSIAGAFGEGPADNEIKVRDYLFLFPVQYASDTLRDKITSLAK